MYHACKLRRALAWVTIGARGPCSIFATSRPCPHHVHLAGICLFVWFVSQSLKRTAIHECVPPACSNPCGRKANWKMLATRSLGVSSFGLPPDGACSPNLPIGGLASRSRSSCCQVRNAHRWILWVVSEDQQLCWFFLRPFHKAWPSGSGHVTGRSRLLEEKPQLRVRTNWKFGRTSWREFSFYWIWSQATRPNPFEKIQPDQVTGQVRTEIFDSKLKENSIQSKNYIQKWGPTRPDHIME